MSVRVFASSALRRRDTRFELTAVFSEANQAYFCDKEGSTKVAPLFGQVGLAYQLNFAALPRLPGDQDQTAPMPADVLAMRWVLHWGSVEAGDVDGLGLTTAQQSAIQSIRYDLAEHLAWLAENPKKSKYRLDPATPLASINTPDARDAYRQPASWTPTPNELGSSAK